MYKSHYYVYVYRVPSLHLLNYTHSTIHFMPWHTISLDGYFTFMMFQYACFTICVAPNTFKEQIFTGWSTASAHILIVACSAVCVPTTSLVC